jgi:cytochrome c-type biogenesis protein CcmH/NrfF
MSAKTLEKPLTPKSAHRQYMGRMLGASGGYIGAVFGAAMVLDDGDPVSLITLAVAALPAIFILLMLRAVWTYINQVDEVARHDHVEAMLVALFVMLAIGGSWGLVEMFNASVPRLSIFWVFPGFFMIYGLVAVIRYRRCA